MGNFPLFVGRRYGNACRLRGVLFVPSMAIPENAVCVVGLEYAVVDYCHGVRVLRGIACQLDTVGKIRIPRGKGQERGVFSKILLDFCADRVDRLGDYRAGCAAARVYFARNYAVRRDGIFITLGRMAVQNFDDLHRFGVQLRGEKNFHFQVLIFA